MDHHQPPLSKSAKLRAIHGSNFDLTTEIRDTYDRRLAAIQTAHAAAVSSELDDRRAMEADLAAKFDEVMKGLLGNYAVVEGILARRESVRGYVGKLFPRGVKEGMVDVEVQCALDPFEGEGEVVESGPIQQPAPLPQTPQSAKRTVVEVPQPQRIPTPTTTATSPAEPPKLKSAGGMRTYIAVE
ncbi:hypothetical protein HK104_004959 [Borealophlyctis nickersoniae]|nr:hypothetical protein HK104_004959 [Borealophlyctis nickersoniae]